MARAEPCVLTATESCGFFPHNFQLLIPITFDRLIQKMFLLSSKKNPLLDIDFLSFSHRYQLIVVNNLPAKFLYSVKHIHTSISLSLSVFLWVCYSHDQRDGFLLTKLLEFLGQCGITCMSFVILCSVDQVKEESNFAYLWV